MQERADVVVVGGGPAGSIAALELARRGVRVLLCEAQRYPRDKICGDGLIPDSLRLLGEMGLRSEVEAEAHRPTQVRIFSPNGRSVALDAPLLTLRRARLDALLAQAAERAGARLCQGLRVREPLRDADHAVAGVVARSEDGTELEIRAPITILATGAGSQMLAAFGVPARSQPSAVAMRAYYQMPALAQSELVISYEKPVMPGYGWVFPMGKGEANVGVGLFLVDGVTGENLRHLFERFLESCPHVAEAMRGARALGPPKGAPLRCGFAGSPLTAPGLLLAGETIGTTYALSGEGIGKAMESGRLAARAAAGALEAGRFDRAALGEYERQLRAAGFPEKFAQYDKAQRWVKHSTVVNLVTARAAKSHRVRGLLEAMVREEISPERVFSVGGLARALIG